MAHPDQETRVGSHRIFSAVLMPALKYYWSIPVSSLETMASYSWVPLLIALSAFSSSTIILETIRQKNCSVPLLENGVPVSSGGDGTGQQGPSHSGIALKQLAIDPSHGQHDNISPALHLSTEAKSVFELGKEVWNSILSCHFVILLCLSVDLPFHDYWRPFSCKHTVQGPLHLSSHQVDLLLSSIWVQATSQENNITNYEAMAHTYSLSLLFAQSKVSFLEDLFHV